MKKLCPAFLLFTAVVLILSSCNNSSDWPGWRGPERDGKVMGFEAPDEWPATLTQSWQTTVGECDASPILVNDKLYLHVRLDSAEQALCIDAETGEIIWQTNINPAPEVTGGPRTHPGPRSTPEFVKGKIITEGAGGILTCLDAKSGEIIWKNESYTFEIPRFFTSVSPLIKNDMFIMHLGGQEKGVIVAFDIDSGDEKWKIEGEPCTYSSPVIWKTDPEQILVQTETDLLGISFDGKILWRIPTPGERMFYNSSTPVYAGSKHFVSGQGIGTTAYEVKSAEGEYSFEQLWNNPDYGVSFCTPVVKNGYLFANDKGNGSLYSLNIENGELGWADTVKLNRFASVFDLGEVLVSLAASGDLVFFAPDTQEYIELAKYKVSETAVYASPVFSKDMIYTKDETTLTCWFME